MPWAQRQTSRGFQYDTWVYPMPRIEDQLLNSIVYLYPRHDAADTGTEEGGSGFVLYMLSENSHTNHYLKNCAHTYVVTNKHVVDDGSRFIRVNHEQGGIDVITTDAKDWLP